MEDSLEQRYSTRIEDYKLYINKFFHYRNPKKLASDTIVSADSTLTGVKNPEVTQSLYAKEAIPDSSFYLFLETENQLRTIEAAKNLTRNSRNYIKRSEEEFDTRTRYINRYKIEWHRKLMLSFACVILFFVGAPMGAIIRKGGFGFPVVFSIIFFLIFHISNTSGEKMAKTGVVSPLIGMWLGIMVLIPFAIFLTYKAINDSSVLEKDFYKKMFIPLLRIIRKKKVKDESTSTLS